MELSSDTMKLIELKYRDGDAIVDTTISDDAQWIAFSTLNTIRIYNISVVSKVYNIIYLL